MSTPTPIPDVNADPSARKYHNTKSAYALPNDSPEHTRLETQASLLRQLMSNRVIHAPLPPTIHKALDIGSGTGSVTHDIASSYPSCQVIGLDLSPVPAVREKLPNITYVQGDFTALVGRDDRFGEEMYDYVFSRLLIMGMTDWEGYVGKVVRILKKGGWVEMHETDCTFSQIPERITPAEREAMRPHYLDVPVTTHPLDAWEQDEPWINTFRKLAAAKGMNARAGRELARWFVEAGLKDVSVKRYLWPSSKWDGWTDLERRIAEHHRTGMGPHFPVLLKKMGEGQDVVGSEEIEAAVEDAKKSWEDWETSRDFVWIYVVCGRKE